MPASSTQYVTALSFLATQPVIHINSKGGFSHDALKLFNILLVVAKYEATHSHTFWSKRASSK